jgi:hypothetical protein
MIRAPLEFGCVGLFYWDVGFWFVIVCLPGSVDQRGA